MFMIIEAWILQCLYLSIKEIFECRAVNSNIRGCCPFLPIFMNTECIFKHICDILFTQICLYFSKSILQTTQILLCPPVEWFSLV